MINSFAPILPDHPKILILGTMPGVKSLERQQYYAHPQNHFWKILFGLLENAPVPEDYQARKELLARHRIALWDVLESCHREGSLDANIKDAVENPIPALLATHPTLKAIAFNGKESQKIFEKRFGTPVGYAFLPLPSTSPANTISFDKKLKSWKEILAFL